MHYIGLCVWCSERSTDARAMSHCERRNSLSWQQVIHS